MKRRDQTFSVSGVLIISDLIAVSADGGGAFPQDNGEFAELVQPVSGNESEARGVDSDFSMARYAVAIGLRTPFLAVQQTKHGWTAVALHADIGEGWLSGSRGIPDCVNCTTEHLQFRSGNFWRVGADLTVPATRLRYGVTAEYQRYLGSSSVTDELQVKGTFTF